MRISLLMIIDIIATLIESSIFTLFLFFYFDIKLQKHFILLVLFWLLENYVFFYITNHNNYFAISVICSNILFLVIHFKKITFSYISYPLLLYGLLLFSNTIALSFVSFLYKIPLIEVSTNSTYLISGIIVSRILFLIFAILVYKFVNKKKETTFINEWWQLFIFFAILFLMTDTLLSSIILDKMNINIIYLFLFELFMLMLISFVIYFKIQKQNLLNVQMSNELVKKEYQKKMYNLINSASEQLNNDKHLMQYSFLKLKNLLKTKEYDQAYLFVNNELTKHLNYRFIASSNNPLFDYELTIKINKLISNNIDVKTALLISKYNTILDDNSLITFIMDSIEKYNVSNKMELLFREIDDYYILFKIILPKPVCSNVNNIANDSHTKLKNFNFSIGESSVIILFLFGNEN